MEWFDENVNGKPYWSLWMGWNGKNLLTSYCAEDGEKARDTLYQNIYTAEQNHVDDVYMLKLHHTCMKGGIITNKSAYYASLPFRPAALPPGTNMQQIYPLNVQGQSPELRRINDRLDQLGAILESRFAEEEDEDELPALPPPPAKLGGFAALLENPAVIGAITNIGMGIVNSILAKFGLMQPPGQPAAAIGAIIEVSDKMKQAIGVLQQYTPTLDEDLLQLAALAQSNPQQFTMFLNMLRNSKG